MIFSKTKKICQRAFYDPNSKLFTIINDFISIVIVISILTVILHSITELKNYFYILDIIEYTTVTIFVIEYIGRIIGTDKKKEYIFSFFGLIDLISIVPSILHVYNLTPLKSIRALRILRFLRIIRLARVIHFNHAEKKPKRDALDIIKLNLQIYAVALISVIIILGNLIYIFEHEINSNFANIPISMVWVLESILGGSISSVTPQTYAGIGIFMIARFVSLFLLGFLVHIAGNIINHLLLGKKTAVSKEDI